MQIRPRACARREHADARRQRQKGGELPRAGRSLDARVPGRRSDRARPFGQALRKLRWRADARGPCEPRLSAAGPYRAFRAERDGRRIEREYRERRASGGLSGDTLARRERQIFRRPRQARHRPHDRLHARDREERAAQHRGRARNRRGSRAAQSFLDFLPPAQVCRIAHDEGCQRREGRASRQARDQGRGERRRAAHARACSRGVRA